MRSSVFVIVAVLLLGCVLSFASPALPPTPAPASPAASEFTPNSDHSASSFEVSEYQVDSEGLWTDHEIPLSDASIEAIHHATAATSEDIDAWNAEAEPEMRVQAAEEEQTDDNNASSFDASEYAVDSEGLFTDHEIPLSDASIEAIRHVTPATPEDIDAWNAEVEPEIQVQAVIDDEEETEANAENESSIQDDLEITHGHHGRMLLIPHSRRIMMRRIIMFLTRLISKLKSRSPLARISLKLKVEPVTPPTSTPSPTPDPTRVRRPPPALGILHRPHPRPVAIRLIPSRTQLQTRKLLARCSMLLRMAVQRLHKMRQMMIKDRMKRRRITGLRFPSSGVVLFRSNNITASGPAYTSTTLNRFEIEGEKNGTVTIIAPRINATLDHPIIVINQGSIILINRSRNNTLAVSVPRRSRHSRPRRFRLWPSHNHIMNENIHEIQHDA